MRITLETLFVVVGVLAAFGVLGSLGLWLARRRRDAAVRAQGAPLLVMPVTSPREAMRLPVADFARSSPIRNVAINERIRMADERVRVTHDADARTPVSAAVVDPITATTHQFVPGDVPADMVFGHTLRFHRPADGTLAFLPGHLEVVGGPDAGHEIRFVRPPQAEEAVISFGRKEGAPYRHVQLLEATVSRSHARLAFDGLNWRLTNLSRTNPVVLNGKSLDALNTSQLLSDGDVMEMGALVFRFHAHR